MARKPKIVVISGPTASGKTALAMDIAERFSAEIINADSVTIYDGFEIGGAMPSADERERVPHSLLSLLSLEEDLDAGRFCQLAKERIEICESQGRLPLIVGGAGLYIRSLLCGLIDTGPITEEARVELEAREEQFDSVHQLHDWLAEIDPLSAERLHPNDANRVRRALLVCLSSGSSITELQTQQQHSDAAFESLVFVVMPERERLYQIIDERVDVMLANGLVEEVKALRERYGVELKALRGIGYRHVAQYLDGELDLQEMTTTLKRDTKRYAKRQSTWWRNQPEKLGWTKFTDHPLTGECNEANISDETTRIIRAFLDDALPLTPGVSVPYVELCLESPLSSAREFNS